MARRTRHHRVRRHARPPQTHRGSLTETPCPPTPAPHHPTGPRRNKPSGTPTAPAAPSTSAPATPPATTPPPPHTGHPHAASAPPRSAASSSAAPNPNPATPPASPSAAPGSPATWTSPHPASTSPYRSKTAPSTKPSSSTTPNSSLDLDGCTLPALEAEGIRADSWFGLRNARIAGELWLFNARIGGEADLRGTTVGTTATLGSIVVDGTLRLSGRLHRHRRNPAAQRPHHRRPVPPPRPPRQPRPHRTRRLRHRRRRRPPRPRPPRTRRSQLHRRPHRHRSLTFVDVHFDNPDDWALLLIEATCTMLTLRPAPGSTGRISLRDAHTARFVDDVLGWPDNLAVELDGFTYQRLTHRSDDHARPTAEQRLAWLDRQHGADFGTGPRPFAPAPYEQLAAAMRADGREADARHVLRAKERLRHRALGRAAGTWGALQDAAVGFGYHPARALTWIAVLLAGGTGYFRWAGAPHPSKQAKHPPGTPSSTPSTCCCPSSTSATKPPATPPAPTKPSPSS
ncbi:hypothetical protein ACU686_35500 [Yinghuangia aomiensis]